MFCISQGSLVTFSDVVEKCIRISVKCLQDTVYQKWLKSVYFSWSYTKIMGEWRFFLRRSVRSSMIRDGCFRCLWRESKWIFGTSLLRTQTVLWQYAVDVAHIVCRAQTHRHPFNGPLSGTTQVSQYQKGKTNLDFTEARDSGWQWHQLGHNASLHLAPGR